jgi:phosphate transport system substrate-binding protein
MFKKRMFLTAAVAATMVAALAVPSVALAAGSLKLSGSTTCQPVVQLISNSFARKYPGTKVTVAGGGSGVGISDVLAGRVNVGMSSRDLKSTEKSKGAYGTAFARDAMTIIVNPHMPVRKLTNAQVKAIYTGRITNWKQVGGPNATIVVCGRTAPSGTFDFFVEKFLGTSRQSSRVKTYSSNGLVRNAVKSNNFAIGYVGMAYVNSTVRGVALDGVSPTRTNAVSGKYKYVRRLWYVTKGRPAGLAKTFIDFSLSSTGQSLVASEYLRIR